MPSDESKGSQLDAIGSLAQRQLDNTVKDHAQRQRRRSPQFGCAILSPAFVTSPVISRAARSQADGPSAPSGVSG